MPANLKRGLSANMIKLIAAAAMLIDHIAWLRFPLTTQSGFIMHTIGRITAPIMCFFIAEGYFRTRSVMRYALRLLIFAIIAQLPFHFYMTGQLNLASAARAFGPGATYNVMFTLLLGLLALHALSSRRLPAALRIFIAALCCAMTYGCDWPFFGVLFIIAFGRGRKSFARQTLMFCAICAVLLAISLSTGEGRGALYQAGVLLALPILRIYSGRRGAVCGIGLSRAVKYSFYIFYPLHLLLLAATL